MADRYFITGATGFVGGHLAEQCIRKGHAVVTVARSGSDTALLQQWGVTIHRGDLTDPAVIRAAVQGANIVVHCAAKVGDWGPVEDYRAVNVEGTRHLLEACRGAAIKRFVHLSSLGVYAARHHYGTDESEPLPPLHMDGYTQTKVESEKLVLQYHRDHQLPVVVLRPGFIYGPRDRTVLPRIAANLKAGRVVYFARGRYTMNTIYVSNLIDAIFLAVENPKAIGQIYNLTDGDTVSKRRFFETVADGLGLPRPRRSLPLWLGRIGARAMERRALRRRATEAPRLTRATFKFLALNLDFSIVKARTELGYSPRIGFDEGIKATIEWHRSNVA